MNISLKFLILLAVPLPSHAQQVIKIQPGGSIEIFPNNRTVVVCEPEGKQPAERVLSRFCHCSWGAVKGREPIKKAYRLLQTVIWVDGHKTDHVIEVFDNDENACNAKALSHKACR